MKNITWRQLQRNKRAKKRIKTLRVTFWIIVVVGLIAISGLQTPIKL